MPVSRRGALTLRFPSAATFAGLPRFSGEVVLQGSAPDAADRDEAGRIWVDVDGLPESLCFYGCEGRKHATPLIFLEGDCSRRDAGVWSVYKEYVGLSPYDLQIAAEQHALALDRPFVNLARPGVYGSSGNHQQRRRPREVAVVDAALTELVRAFGWSRFDIAGFSGGGHLVAALMARRSDIGCAVIASGNVWVRQRNRDLGIDADVTGYTDFIDPIDLVAEVARHPPQTVVALTDPLDKVVSAVVQTAYVEALRAAGVPVDHRLVPATDAAHHQLGRAALLAAAAACSPSA